MREGHQFPRFARPGLGGAFQREPGKLEPPRQPTGIGYDHGGNLPLDRMGVDEPHAPAWQALGPDGGGEKFRQTHDTTPIGYSPSGSCHLPDTMQLTLLSRSNASTRTQARRYRRFNPAAKCQQPDALDVVLHVRNTRSRGKNNQRLVVGVVWDTSLSTDFFDPPF